MQSAIDFNEDKVWKRTLNLNNGQTIRQVGYGCYNIATAEPIYDAIKYGYRLLDSASYYENEELVGQQVKRAYVDFGLNREDLFVTSKVWPSEMGYEKTKAAVEASLEKMDLGYINLMLLHFPVNDDLPKEYPNHVEDRQGTWRALEEFVESGKVKSIGVSNFLPHQIETILSIAKVKPAVNQFELHPMYVETETIECCRKNGIVVQAYSPFAQWTEKLVTHPTLIKISEAHGIDVAKVIILWAVHPTNGFALLPKSATSTRIASNIQLEGLEGLLTESDMADINELAKEDMPVDWKAHDYP